MSTTALYLSINALKMHMAWPKRLLYSFLEQRIDSFLEAPKATVQGAFEGDDRVRGLAKTYTRYFWENSSLFEPCLLLVHLWGVPRALGSRRRQASGVMPYLALKRLAKCSGRLKPFAVAISATLA